MYGLLILSPCMVETRVKSLDIPSRSEYVMCKGPMASYMDLLRCAE
jgi:hypothetical protein